MFNRKLKQRIKDLEASEAKLKKEMELDRKSFNERYEKNKELTDFLIWHVKHPPKYAKGQKIGPYVVEAVRLRYDEEAEREVFKRSSPLLASKIAKIAVAGFFGGLVGLLSSASMIKEEDLLRSRWEYRLVHQKTGKKINTFEPNMEELKTIKKTTKPTP